MFLCLVNSHFRARSWKRAAFILSVFSFPAGLPRRFLTLALPAQNSASGSLESAPTIRVYSTRRLGLLVLGGLTLIQFGCSPRLDLAPAPPFTYAFVTNSGSHTLSVIDLKSFKNVKTIPVGKSPTKVTASHKGICCWWPTPARIR